MSRQGQSPKTGRIAFQGELGAYSHQACRDARPDLEPVPCRTFEDVIAAVGRNELSSVDVLKAVFPDHKDERVTIKPSVEDGWVSLPKGEGMAFRLPDADSEAGVPLRGLNGAAIVRFSPSGAVPSLYGRKAGRAIAGSLPSSFIGCHSD